MSKNYFSLFLLTAALALVGPAAQAQTDLLGDLEKTAPVQTKREVVQATFKATHIINSQSVEIQGPGTLNFIIQHRFGTLNEGAYALWGLDNAVIRFSFEYGLTDRLSLGVGRSSFGKTYDSFVKYRALRQTSGAGAMPVSLTLLASSAIMTQRIAVAPGEAARTASSRLAYTYQALIARKFSPELSVQLMPTLVHRNFVPFHLDKNDVLAMGIGFRQKITKRTAITGDYFYLLPGTKSRDTFSPVANPDGSVPRLALAMRNSLGIGVDIESGGHVFQLHLTNAKGMSESVFIPQTTGRFEKGDIYFGFAINRNFTVKSNLN